MKLRELLRAAAGIAQTGGNPERIEALAREAESLADMVGWAGGAIDPTGDWLTRLAAVQDDLQARHAQTREEALAILNDALIRLGQAIARHDSDLEDSDGAGDDGEDFT